MTRRGWVAALAAGAAWLGGCRQPPPRQGVTHRGPSEAIVRQYNPARDLGSLFHDVQMARVFPDSKTFADARPLQDPAQLRALYDAIRHGAGVDLRRFVAAHFALPPAVPVVAADSARDMEAHIRALWPVLTRAADAPDPRSSRIALPHRYLVPGGRFREIYYWDSYFTMLGLVASGHAGLVKDMLDNFAWLVREVGHVPNGNRTYYLDRSQPPFLAAMVGRYAAATDTARAQVYLDALEREHRFWMRQPRDVPPGRAIRRVVRMPDGATLNRYWDAEHTPRPESYREDEALGRGLGDSARAALFTNIRAAAESGWDFSSRWMRDPSDLRTLETIEIVPVDLNALLWNEERTIAALLRARRSPADSARAATFDAAAARRRRALLAAAWDSADGWFYDVRWRDGSRIRGRPTLAAVVPLYFGIATPEQGRRVAARLEREFLRSGGFVTTRVTSGQQWDAPNGWAPLQWMAIEGLRRYGRGDLADVAAARWLALNRRTFAATGRMMEKYDVVDPARRAGGGEYPAQDGFGWTNGVALALAARQRDTMHAPPAFSPRVQSLPVRAKRVSSKR